MLWSYMDIRIWIPVNARRVASPIATEVRLGAVLHWYLYAPPNFVLLKKIVLNKI